MSDSWANLVQHRETPPTQRLKGLKLRPFSIIRLDCFVDLEPSFFLRPQSNINKTGGNGGGGGVGRRQDIRMVATGLRKERSLWWNPAEDFRCLIHSISSTMPRCNTANEKAKLRGWMCAPCERDHTTAGSSSNHRQQVSGVETLFNPPARQRTSSCSVSFLCFQHFFFLSVVAVVVALSVSVTDVVELTLWETAADENGCSDGHQRGIVKTLNDLFLFSFYLTRCFSCHCCTLT